MTVCTAENKEYAGLWQRFVDDHSEASIYHCWDWKHVIEKSFGWPTYYLMAKEGGETKGILPLVWQRSWIFGSFLTSLPFLNTGGIVAEDIEARQSLLNEAIRLAKHLGVRYLELRHRRDQGLNLISKTTKVAPVRPVEPDHEKMWQSLEHKVRTDIRKALKSGLEATFGGAEFVDDFYEVFAENMRNLGTPVYSRNFFCEIIRTFPNDARICLVRHGATTVATSFLIGSKDTLEAVWSASRYGYLTMRPNMLLYWKILCMAGERRYQFFDFGRSTVGSGTHRFKQQWGTVDVPLHWDYWLDQSSSLPELNPENPRFRLAISIWKRLPVALTALIGPRIVRCLP